MCEQTEVNYLDGEVVWVKLGSCWWPGEVVGSEKLPPDLLPSFRKPPIAVVKFFQEDTYEYVKNINSIYKYNCSRKDEFINKGLYMYRTKHGHMEKFPEDVIRAETAVGGDIEILTRDEFQENKKESYAGLFGESAKRTPGSSKKSKGGKAESPRITTPIRKLKEKVDYKVHILVQGSKSAPPSTPTSDSLESIATPSTSTDTETDIKGKDESGKENGDKSENIEKPAPATPVSTPTSSSSGMYSCHACPFTTSRLNVLILHNKTHSVSFTPYTPTSVRKKVTPKATKSTPNSSKTPKVRKPRKEKSEKVPKESSKANKKRAAEEQANAEAKKIKTDEEIKSSLLADWDDGDEESNDESSAMVMAGSPEVPETAGSPEVPETAESPAVPTSAELSSLPLSGEASASPAEKKPSSSPTSEKPESSSSDSKYEFCEDEDWHVEADAGRKIPRVKNPKRKEDTKSLSLDEDDVAREVAELLNKTTVPELPSAPEPLKVEENFPEPSIVKSPDKQDKSLETSEKPPETPPNKAIFKTKTFFRSRHSRSQDAIGKYVAEQLNAVERMDIADSETNGSEVASSPEARESPPIDHVKVARLAPKIQLKKMKAEAAQREKSNFDHFNDVQDLNRYGDISAHSPSLDISQIKENDDKLQDIITTQELSLPSKSLTGVLYPTQEIKPVYTDDVTHVKSVLTKTDISSDGQKDEFHDIDESSNKEIAVTEDDTVEKPDESRNVMDIGTDKIDSKVNDGTPAVVETFEIDANDNEINETVNAIDETINDTNITSSDETNISPKETNNVPDDDETNKTPNETDKTPCETDELSNEVSKIPNETNTTLNESNATTNDNVKISHKIDVTTDELYNVAVMNKMDIMDETYMTCNNQPANNEVESSLPTTNTDTDLNKTYEQPVQSYMNESTASAVDALLSVSREADRVTRVVSDDLPEDLFEDDNKDNVTCNTINGYNNVLSEDTAEITDKDMEQDKYKEENNELKNDFNEFKNSEKSQDSVNEPMLVEDRIVNSDEQIVIDSISERVVESIPSESDLQIAETLLNLPSTPIQSKICNDIQIENLNIPDPVEPTKDSDTLPVVTTVLDEKLLVPVKTKGAVKRKSKSLLIPNNDNLLRFETEQEKSENLNAAQSLVQMSESIDHKLSLEHSLNNTVNTKDVPDKALLKTDHDNGLDSVKSVEQKVAMLSNDNTCETSNVINNRMDTSSSKLLKILEEPCVPKIAASKPIIKKQVIIPGKEKILNFDVAKSSFKGKCDTPKQKIIIRRTTTGKNIINKVNDVQPEKIILSRSRDPGQDGAVQTYTIQTSPDPPSDANRIIIQQKMRKVAKPPTKLQKIKPLNSLVNPVAIEPTTTTESTADEAMFDINSMPIVLSEDLITPESIEKMPIVMSDGNILTHSPNPPKLVKTKAPEPEKVAISSNTNIGVNKPETKTLLMNPVSDVNKVATTPNILSKSSKLRGAKPMLVIDKTTGKQKIVMTKSEPTVKEVKPAPTLIQPAPPTSGKGDKFIILPTQTAPRPGRTQKIVIDPQTGKAHVLVTKGPETHLGTDNKPVSAKLIPSSTDVSAPGNTVMIITNAQGAQSRIVLTPEHEKMLFPKKQQGNVSQLKTITHRISTAAGAPQKTVTTVVAAKPTQNFVSAKTQILAPVKTQGVAQQKTPARIVPKQKSAIITSKGQLIVGGRVATTAQNVAPGPDVRPVPKRIMASEPKKLVQTIQKASSETLIFLQQKSGAVMQLTAAQFEHLQRTGQIVQKGPAPALEHKPKKITISPADLAPKPRVRKTISESPTPAKRLKQEIAIAPSLSPPVPPMSPLGPAPAVPAVSNTVSVTTSSFPEFYNFEDMLPSTAIVRQQEPPAPPLAPPPPEPAPPLTDGQLLAVPGEHFGGPAGSFYLCVEDNGTLTPIDNRPLVLENNQLVPMAEPPPPPAPAAPERRDILEAALANSDVFHADSGQEVPDFRDLNANVSVHCRVSETSTTLHQPIMTPVEVPSRAAGAPAPAGLEAGLAVIGVTPHAVPTSLELPITVTDPRIAPRATDPLGGAHYGATLLPSPGADYVTAEETVGPISMPLLTDDDPVGKSMPILTDDVAERAVSSVESTVGSPSSVEVREEMDDGGQWTRRLLTPGSDTSEASAEIPLQPSIQLSVAELARHS